MKKAALALGVWFMLWGGSFGIAQAQATGRAEEPMTSPRTWNFDKPEEFEDDWVTIDRDGDKTTWTYLEHTVWPALDGGTKGGCLWTRYNSTAETDDWLMTRLPMHLSQGKAYVSFIYAINDRTKEERLAVYYGKENDPAKMKRVDVFTYRSRDWALRICNVDIAEEGDYYFAIQACSDPDMSNIYVDEIEIGSGEYMGSPNLVLNYLYLPLSSCNMGEGEMSVMLCNRGKVDIHSFELSYTVNGGTPQTQTFETELKAFGPMQTVTFDSKADFSEPDKVYRVEVRGSVLTADGTGAEGEGMLADNKYVDSVKHFVPVDLPFMTDMNKAEERAQWAFQTGSWGYDASQVLAITSEDTLPLVSRCVELEAGMGYRFAFDYVAGRDVASIVLVPEDFDVLVGPVDKPMSEWKVLNAYRDMQTHNALASDELIFKNEEAGTYAFAFLPKTPFGQLYIQRVVITKVYDHDVALSDWVTRLGRLTPARHAVKPGFEALVANRGLNDESGVKVVLKKDGTVIGQSATADIKKDSLYVFRPVDGAIPTPALNSEVTLTVSLEMPATDGNPYDNTAEFTFTATDTLYVFDNVGERPTRGAGNRNYTVANIFTLAERDTLTAVEVVWVDISEEYKVDFPVAIEIYPVNMATRKVEAAFMHYETMRGLTGGPRRIELPSCILPAGHYLIGVRQLDQQNLAVAVDDNEDGYFFLTANGTYLIEGGSGFLGVRAIFGHVEQVVSKDIALLEIDRPQAMGVFTANQMIRVQYVNNGCDTVEAEFTCTVGEQVLTQKKVVPGYGRGNVTFRADMSKPGQYNIAVMAALTEGEDEDEANNALKKTVECVSVDPRILNFELCDDFAIQNFTPAWKSVDRDGEVSYPYTHMTFPNSNVPFGFITFNSKEFGLVSPETGAAVNVAHSGERFGLSLVTAKNDDWLISPQFTLGKQGEVGMEFYVRSNAADYLESYYVLVSTENDDPDSFEPIGGVRTAPRDWTKVTVDLSDYAGKAVYLAIRCVSENKWWFMIDDIEVKTGDAGREAALDLSRYVKSYPNPAVDLWTVTAYGLEINRVEICDMTGGVVFRSAGNLATDTYRVNMGGFKPGLYMARVYTNAGVQTLKVVVR